MPHGALTPLGRELRRVVSGLGCKCSFPLRLHHANPSSIGSRNNHQAAREVRANPLVRAYTVAAPAVAPSRRQQIQERDHTLDHSSAPPSTYITARRQRRRTRTRHLSEVLKPETKYNVSGFAHTGRVDASHVNLRSRRGRQNALPKQERHATDYRPTVEHDNTPKLENILARYLLHIRSSRDSLTADWEAVFRLRKWEGDLLRQRGHSLEDVRTWASIVTASDSSVAAVMLAKETAVHGIDKIPLFICSHLLERASLGPHALSLLMIHLVNRFERCQYHDIRSMAAPFAATIRLVRHARNDWPQALPSIATLFLRSISEQGNLRKASSAWIQDLTHKLNATMHLISLATTIEPYKNIEYQQEAVVRVLRYMAEQTPPLQINRVGYRAVVRIQLAQKKTKSEQRWARLKALSWPPWKEDRTRMDTELGPEHGVTRAGETLQRMQEAGYSHRPWEKIAMIYAGWNDDGTPTIQSRKFLSPTRGRSDHDAQLWVARIDTTRTAQEAWACYLAQEEGKHTPNMDVYLAIFRRLFQEERRVRMDRREDGDSPHSRNASGLLPGDSREIEPLPPSTHLYTYTSSPPPTVEAFFNQLQDRGVVLSGDCLAFIVSNASTLQLGLEYLRKSTAATPSIPALLDSSWHDHCHLAEVPKNLLIAFLQLLCRFSNVSLKGLLPLVPTEKLLSPILRLNSAHPIVYAMCILERFRLIYRPAWNSVLEALAKEASAKAITAATIPNDVARTLALEQPQPVVAYRLAKKTLRLMQNTGLLLDATGFMHVCLVMENAAIGCWQVLHSDFARSESERSNDQLINRHAIRFARDLFKVKQHEDVLQSRFQQLEGADRTPATSLSNCPDWMELPRLPLIPGPELLHAYIRALGWLASYDSIQGLVHWMVEYKAELAERCTQYKNGEVLMRRALIALRVFLERSWLDERHYARRTVFSEVLQRVERPASRELIEDVRRKILSVEDWGPWPDDDEVEEYCQNYKFARFKSACARTLHEQINQQM